MSPLPWLLVILAACCVESYKVLVVFPFPGKSHAILGDGVVRLLLKAGHEVTYITPILNKKPPPNLHQIDVTDNYQMFVNNKDMINIAQFFKVKQQMTIKSLFDFMFQMHKMTFNNPNVQRLCKDPKQHFDVIIGEWMFNDLYSLFSTIFQAPFIWVSTVDPHWMALQLIDQSTNPAYTADIQSNSIPPFTFYERVQQLVYQIVGYGLKKFYAAKYEQEIIELVKPLIQYRGHEVPDFEELRYNSSLMLGNSHVSMGSAMALPQNYKPIAGYHIETDIKPLPEDLQKLMDNAKHGVIYFSMGSNLKSRDFPDEVKMGLVRLFGELKQTVLWKFEEVLPGAPSNLKFLQWAPQASILAHPNCILFITHGGLLSTTETVHFGKPIIGIPVFADQFINVERAVKNGFATKVDLDFNMVEDLRVAITEMINNPSFTKRVKELSFIYHHRPVSPGAELVHWVEHVVKTQGAPHLRSPALDVPFYQKTYLDLAAVLLATIYVVFATLKFICKRFLCSRGKISSKNKKNN
ncbi:hypothetical protein ACJJTC_018481 [Scirpophaga incertulas]